MGERTKTAMFMRRPNGERIPLPLDASLSWVPSDVVPEGLWQWEWFDTTECDECGNPYGEVTTTLRMDAANLEFS